MANRMYLINNHLRSFKVAESWFFHDVVSGLTRWGCVGRTLLSAAFDLDVFETRLLLCGLGKPENKTQTPKAADKSVRPTQLFV
jgi:hypothetical protein